MVVIYFIEDYILLYYIDVMLLVVLKKIGKVKLVLVDEDIYLDDVNLGLGFGFDLDDFNYLDLDLDLLDSDSFRKCCWIELKDV